MCSATDWRTRVQSSWCRRSSHSSGRRADLRPRRTRASTSTAATSRPRWSPRFQSHRPSFAPLTASAYRSWLSRRLFDHPLVREVRADSRQRHRAIDRFGEVVVGPGAEGLDDVRPLGAGGDHDDGQVGLIAWSRGSGRALRARSGRASRRPAGRDRSCAIPMSDSASRPSAATSTSYW